MAYEEKLESISLLANADLSAKRFYLVKLANASGTAKAALCGDGEDAVGVLQNDPASGEVAQVGVGGVARVICGGAVTAGARFASDANGKAVAVGTGETSLGLALESGVDGDIIPVLLGKI